MNKQKLLRTHKESHPPDGEDGFSCSQENLLPEQTVEPNQLSSTVLIIDDTPMMISTLSKMLTSKYNVKVATDGEKGLDLLKQHHVDLILLDIYMPTLSGFEVLRRLKNNPETKDIPVIFITGSDSFKDETKAFALGAVNYIKKPFNEANVLYLVNLHISRRTMS